MPEGPEVARATDALLFRLQRGGQFPHLTNFIRFGFSFPVDVESLRPALDQKLLDLFCIGKEYYFVFATATGKIGVRAHHGMKGHWSFDQPLTPANVHFRLDFSFDLENFQKTQTPDLVLYYINERFGQFEILPTETVIVNSVQRLAKGFLGRFVLSREEWLVNFCSLGKTRQLRLVLMDQSVLCSGIGNYLLAEILYAARLHPEVTVGQISLEGAAVLYDICSRIIRGHYDRTLEKVIYKRKLSPAGNPIAYVEKGGRKIWYVPAEQGG